MFIISKPLPKIQSDEAWAILTNKPILTFINETVTVFKYDAETSHSDNDVLIALMDGAVVSEEHEPLTAISLVQQLSLEQLNTELLPKLKRLSDEESSAIYSLFVSQQEKAKELVSFALLELEALFNQSKLQGLTEYITANLNDDIRLTQNTLFKGFGIVLALGTEKSYLLLPEENTQLAPPFNYIPYEALVSGNSVSYWVTVEKSDDVDEPKITFTQMEDAFKDLPGSLRDGLAFPGNIMTLEAEVAQNEA